MSEPLTREQFIARFVAYMVRNAGFETFYPDANGTRTTVREYAAETAPSYWENVDQREEGPEECAASDMSYWGEG